MNFFQFLSTYSKVETVIGLVAFIVASILGYFAFKESTRLSKISKIISKADTQSKADLAMSILEVLPTYKIPDLNEKHGFEIVKIQLKQRETEFTGKLKILRLSIVLLVLLVLAIIGKQSFKYVSNTTYGTMSPIATDSSKVTIHNSTKDTVK